MEKPESSCVILSTLNLDDIEEVVQEAYHRDGSGRPPRRPMGIFKALIVKRLQQVPSDRELYRRLWNDPEMREVCDLEAEQKPYHPSQLTRFRNRIGTKRLERIMNKIIRKLLKAGVVGGKTVVMDATFIKAYSKRDPHENSRGGSDPDARVGRNGRTYDLGYKLHVAADAKSELPLALIRAPANENEKKHASKLFDKALKTTRQWMNTLVADSQYSSRKLRDQASGHGVRAVIPYPANQRRNEKGLLRVDRYFRTHGPACERRIYRQRAAVERMNSRLKEHLGLNRHRVKGLKNITTHALLCIIAMLLTALAALAMKRPEKAISITILGRQTRIDTKEVI
jgi:IS5 family transposase